jgi:hypothetical protein
VRKIIHLLIILISIATLASGITQMIMPEFVLSVIGAEATDASSHFFAIVGMFMALFGGLMLHAIYSAVPQRPAILWCSFQKLGAFAAVGLGIINGVFGPLAAGVAIFDLVSGLLFLYYLKLTKHDVA